MEFSIAADFGIQHCSKKLDHLGQGRSPHGFDASFCFDSIYRWDACSPGDLARLARQLHGGGKASPRGRQPRCQDPRIRCSGRWPAGMSKGISIQVAHVATQLIHIRRTPDQQPPPPTAAFLPLTQSIGMCPASLLRFVEAFCPPHLSNCQLLPPPSPHCSRP